MKKKKKQIKKVKSKKVKTEKHQHDDEHECDVCSGKVNIDLWQEEMEKKYGWYIHFVFGDKSCPSGYNIHTHGLAKFKHPDIQICFPLAKETASGILKTVAGNIKEGKKYFAGMRYSDVITNYEVEIAEAEESGRKVLRIIFPDKNGNFQTYDGKPNKQYQGCKFLPNIN